MFIAPAQRFTLGFRVPFRNARLTLLPSIRRWQTVAECPTLFAAVANSQLLTHRLVPKLPQSRSEE
jgi:hypothetical protein